MDARARAQLNSAMTALADGDRSAFSRVFAGLHPVVLRFAARVLRDEAEAKDVCQRVLMKIFDQAAAFERDRDVIAWALAIVAWECRTARRSTVRRSVMHGALPQSVEATPEDLLAEQQLRAAATDVMGALSEIDRAALHGAFWTTDGKPQTQSPLSRKRKERALQRARRMWRQMYGHS